MILTLTKTIILPITIPNNTHSPPFLLVGDWLEGLSPSVSDLRPSRGICRRGVVWIAVVAISSDFLRLNTHTRITHILGPCLV